MGNLPRRRDNPKTAVAGTEKQANVWREAEAKARPQMRGASLTCATTLKHGGGDERSYNYFYRSACEFFGILFPVGLGFFALLVWSFAISKPCPGEAGRLIYPMVACIYSN